MWLQGGGRDIADLHEATKGGGDVFLMPVLSKIADLLLMRNAQRNANLSLLDVKSPAKAISERRGKK
jgi:hypothetical protein